jgi:protein-tyrosine phosphatase
VVSKREQISVLFVCMGNICRSPSAEGVFREQVRVSKLDLDVEIDSAGTHAYHVGEPPDPRATQAALNRGIDLSAQRARAVDTSDFRQFDFILAMDDDNLELLERMQPQDSTAKVSLLLDFCPDAETAHVPDPYYGGPSGFETVLDLLETACDAFIEQLQQRC